MNIEPWQALLGVALTVVGSYFTARYAGKSSIKVKEMDVAGKAYEQADGITKGLILTLKAEIDSLSGRVEKVELEMAEVRNHNNVLIAYVYRLVDLIRRHGLAEEIPSPPPTGIYL